MPKLSFNAPLQRHLSEYMRDLHIAEIHGQSDMGLYFAADIVWIYLHSHLNSTSHYVLSIRLN